MLRRRNAIRPAAEGSMRARADRTPADALETVKRTVVIHLVEDGPARGWIHTHGLAAHGRPELEARGIPLFAGPGVAALLNEIAAYMLENPDRPVLGGETMACRRATVLFLPGRADEALGYDEDHYATGRLTVVDPPGGVPCECCREEAARSSLH